MREKNWKKSLALALLLCLVGAAGAGVIQSDFGRVEVKEISFQTDAGTYTGYLLIPENATAETPAPGIVTSHGYLNNREMQDINYVELARRGYVVFAQNAYAHGDSSLTGEGASEAEVSTGGMVDAVEYLSSLNFVDSGKIGVTGHSMGGGYTNATAAYYTQLEREALEEGATPEEAAKKNKVAAAFIVGNYPLALSQTGDTSGDCGYLCDLGINAGQFDEFYFGMSENFGYELLTSDNTRNLVAVQTGQRVEQAEEGKFYENSENGYRLVLYNPAEFHALNHFSPATVSNMITFFEKTLGAPKPMEGSSQIWWVKELFNLIGLIGFFAFVVPFAACLLELPFFRSLRAQETVTPALPKKMGRYVAGNTVAGIINTILILPTTVIGYLFLKNSFWPQDTTGGIGLWAVFCGLVMLLPMRCMGKKFRERRQEMGISIEKKAFGKLSLIHI